MLFVCYPKCTTCQKAKAWLEGRGLAFDVRDIKTDRPTEAELRQWHEKGISYTLRDIKTENPTQEELRTWWQESGLPLKRFFNTSGLQYKALGLKDKLPQMSEDEQFALLSTDGMLVKRPILVGDGFVLVGFKPAEWEARFGKNGGNG